MPKKKCAAKQPPDCSFSCESDIYYNALKLFLLASLGEPVAETLSKQFQKDLEDKVGQCSVTTEFLGISKCLAPQMVLFPSWGLSLSEMRKRFPGGKHGEGLDRCRIVPHSTIILDGEVEFVTGSKVDVDGAIDVQQQVMGDDAKKTLDLSAGFKNAGAHLEAIPDSEMTTDVLKIHGYKLKVEEIAKADKF